MFTYVCSTYIEYLALRSSACFLASPSELNGFYSYVSVIRTANYDDSLSSSADTHIRESPFCCCVLKLISSNWKSFCQALSFHDMSPFRAYAHAHSLASTLNVSL